MTVIAWDGKTLAADQMAFHNDMRIKVSKILKDSEGYLLAITGDLDAGKSLIHWWHNKNLEKWPACQADKDRWASLIVITPEKKIFKFEREPFSYEILDKQFAMGNGAHFALAAMKLGKSAKEAVELAIELCPMCGLGVDELTHD